MTEQTALSPVEPVELSKEEQTAAKKFSKWSQAYLDPESKTYGNATRSALAVYKSKNYFTAGSIGRHNCKKLQSLGITLDEIEGRGLRYWMNLAHTKAKNGTLDELMTWMRELGYLEKPSNVPANQTNLQFNFGSELAERFVQNRKARGLEIPQDPRGNNPSNGSSA